MSDAEQEKVEEIWVDLYEAAEITGYNLHSLRRLAWETAQRPEDEREIKMRKRSSRWELWLPDLFAYIARPNRGPQGKRSEEKPP